MDEKRPNYCHLLGLNPFKESSYSQDDILGRLQAHRTKWENDSRNKQNDTEQRYKASSLAKMCPDIERVMSNQSSRRAEFAAAQSDLRARVQKVRMDCVVLTDGTHLVLPNTLESFRKKLRWEGISVSDIQRLADVYDRAPPKPVDDKVANAYKGLRSVGAYTPVEMLNALIGHPNLEIRTPALTEASSAAQVRGAFEVCEQRVNHVKQDLLPEQDSYIQAMRSVKLVLTPDSELASLASYGRCSRAMDAVEETIEQEFSGGRLTRAYIDDLLQAHSSRDVDHGMALLILQQFCYKKRIPANFSDRESEMTRCPECGLMVKAGPDTLYCPACGKGFKTVCPACGASQPSKNSACVKCGFNFKEGYQQADRLNLEFRSCLQAGRIARAERALGQLKARFPGYSSIPSMDSELSRYKDDRDASRRYILECYSGKRYAEAKSATETLERRFPDTIANDIELSQKYSDSCSRYSSADVRCQKAASMATRQERMEQYAAAAEVCPDHPVARTKLRENPPPGPADPLGSVGHDGVTIKFVAPEDSAGLTYCVYRERNTLPSVDEGTRPLAEFPGTYYTDKSMEPGVEYFYSIHSKRWGVLSKEAAHVGPLMIISEVDRVTLEPIEGGLHLSFDNPRGATRVRVWRSDGEGMSELALNGQTSYDDVGLTGGKKYHYLFVAEYKVRDRVERSQGVTFSETTVDPPAPVNEMVIKKNSTDGTFSAAWKSRERVVLFSTPKKIQIPGTMVSMDDVRSWMTEIKPLDEYPDGVRFALPDGAIQYIYPIIPCGKMGIRGREQLVANLRPFRDVEYTVNGRDCVITMSWPDGAVEAKLVLSNGAVAKGLDDRDAETVTVRREEYNEDRQIRIPVGKQDKRCINIYAVYDVDSKKFNSRGIAIEVYTGESKKVRYTAKKGVGGVAAISLSADPASKELPPMMLVQAADGIPLKRTDGAVVWRSGGPVPLQGGKALVEAKCTGMTDLQGCRLFLENDSDYFLYRFVHLIYGGRRCRGDRRMPSGRRSTPARTASPRSTWPGCTTCAPA